jgi:hypothetical protein
MTDAVSWYDARAFELATSRESVESVRVHAWMAADRLAPEGKRPAFKLGGMWRFRRRHLDEWIAANLTNKDSGASD